MGNVVSMKPREHVYKLDQCSGCNEVITNEYVEISLYSDDKQLVNHIALCNECNEVAESVGVF